MGARSTYTFTNDAEPHAGKDDIGTIYLHWGGESEEECAQTVREFYAELVKLTDPRASDASYLAAKFLVLHAHESRATRTPTHVMEFLSVGIMPERMDGADYGVVFCCGDLRDGLPAAYTAEDTLSDEMDDFVLVEYLPKMPTTSA